MQPARSGIPQRAALSTAQQQFLSNVLRKLALSRLVGVAQGVKILPQMAIQAIPPDILKKLAYYKHNIIGPMTPEEATTAEIERMKKENEPYAGPRSFKDVLAFMQEANVGLFGEPGGTLAKADTDSEVPDITDTNQNY